MKFKNLNHKYYMIYYIYLINNNKIPTNTDKFNLNIKEENKLNITDVNFNKKDNFHNNNINIKANIDNSNLIDDIKDIKFNLDIETLNEIFYDNRKYIKIR